MDEQGQPKFLAVYYDESVVIRGVKEIDAAIYKNIVGPPGPQLIEQIRAACRETEIAGVLTRGSLAWYLHAQKIPVPIFDIKCGIGTVLHLIRVCTEAGYSQIGIFEVDRSALPEEKDGLHEILKLNGCTVRYYKMRNHENLGCIIRQLAAAGALDVVVGDSEPLLIARSLHLPELPFYLDENQWLAALEEARYLTEVTRKEKSQDNFIEVITNIISEAVIIVDGAGRVKRCNQKGTQLFETAHTPSRIEELVPGGMESLLAQPANQLMTMHSRQYVVNVVPLLIGAEEHYAVIFNNVRYVEGMEMSIRRQNKSMGLTAKFTFETMIAQDPATRKLVKVAKKYARTNSTVLICGETGTGKEVFASSIHNASPRAEGPFVAINCAALSETLIESELFGYEKGAFTGALRGGKAGLFELAHRGSIFLDEVGELPMQLQAKLLRVLQEKEIMRVGGNKVIPVDVRVIAATNQDLREMVRENKFREDLYYRLALLEIEIPPLRRRPGDIIPLFTSFLLETAEREGRSIYWNSTDIFMPLLTSPWSGNIRELRNMAERVVLLCEGNKLTESVIASMLRRSTADLRGEAQYSCGITGDLKAFERQYIEFLLRRFGGDRDKLCRYLGMSKTTLWRKLSRGGEDPAQPE